MAVRKSLISLLFLVGMVALTGFLGKTVPSGFLPEEDQGYIYAGIQLPDAASLQRTRELTMQAEQLIMATPGVKFCTSVIGYSMLSQVSNTYSAFFFITLEEWAARKEPAVQYEATRAGLDPQLVLGLIQVESGFNKYAISPVGARGLMQVMPFWVRSIGTPAHNLFELTTNLRYGCTILRHYIDIEGGNLFRALGRYNGSLGQATYPNLVVGAWKRHWLWLPPRGDKLAQAY